MAKDLNVDCFGDMADKDHIEGIPGELMYLLKMAKELLFANYEDLKKSKGAVLEEALEWTFYSKDDDPWSYFQAASLAAKLKGIDEQGSAELRAILLQDPEILAKKEAYDQRKSNSYKKAYF